MMWLWPQSRANEGGKTGECAPQLCVILGGVGDGDEFSLSAFANLQIK